MSHQFVKSFIITERVTYYDVVTQYEYRHEKGHRWLQRLLFRILAKIGAHATCKSVQYNKVEVNIENFLRSFQKYYNMMYQFTGKPPSRILMGPADFRVMTRASFDVTSHQELVLDPNGTYSFNGITIEIVPWMGGFVMLP